MKTWIIRLGGPGSGHFAHKGIPGHRGGSAPGRGGGIASGNSQFTRDFFNSPEGQKLFLRGTSQEVRELVANAYTESAVPPNHIQTMGRITDRVPKNIPVNEDGTLEIGNESPMMLGEKVYAYYDTRNHKMIMSPLMVNELKAGESRAAETLTHELAHIVMEDRWGDYHANAHLRAAHRQVGSGGPSLSDLGLRDYAGHDFRELFAESYSSWIAHPETRAGIQRLYADNHFNFEAFMNGERRTWID